MYPKLNVNQSEFGSFLSNADSICTTRNNSFAFYQATAWYGKDIYRCEIETCNPLATGKIYKITPEQAYELTAADLIARYN